MISTQNVGLQFGARKLFQEVNVKFTPGNCYGLIGANGAGKSTFLKILSGEIEPNTGQVVKSPQARLSVLKQNHFEFDAYPVLKTVMMGNKRLFDIINEKELLYAKPDFSEEDGIRASELETEFAEMNGWEAESEAGILLAGLGIHTEYHEKKMSELSGSEKVKVLLAQALFGRPDILLLDEPTNHLDIAAIYWLQDFLMNFENTVIVVSHDRHFLNQVCTHIADIDFGKISVYSGNYDFWRQASELSLRLRSEKNKKTEDKMNDLKTFIQRFSANASKSKQATSRQKHLEKLQLEDMPVSNRKYPFVAFQSEREAGKDILSVDKICKSIDGVPVLDNLSFIINKGDKVGFLSSNDIAVSTLFDILTGKTQADSGSFQWGVTTSQSYFPADNAEYFDDKSINIVDWLRQFSTDQDESFIRGFLGRMLFSKEEAFKKVSVLSGGEKVRCMLSKMMLANANVLLLDGPTNHLDLESITSVNEGIIKFNGTVLFSSHDHEFIQSIANRIIEIDTQLVDDRFCTYDEYIAHKLRLQP